MWFWRIPSQNGTAISEYEFPRCILYLDSTDGAGIDIRKPVIDYAYEAMPAQRPLNLHFMQSNVLAIIEFEKLLKSVTQYNQPYGAC